MSAPNKLINGVTTCLLHCIQFVNKVMLNIFHLFVNLSHSL